MQSQFPQTHQEWHRRIFHLAWPIILSNLSVPLVGMVDTAVVGHLSNPVYMAAVAVGAVVFSSVFWVFGFLRMGTTGFVSQAYGQHNTHEIALILARALLLALLLGVLVILLQYPLREIAFTLMQAGDDITYDAALYFDIRIWSAPATFINYAVLGCLIGLQRMRLALLTQLVLNSSNIVLDSFFVLGLDMKADGVAWASLFSEVLAAGVGIWLLRDVLSPLLKQSVDKRETWQALIRPEALRALFVVNSDLFLRTLLLSSAFFIFTAFGAQQGAVVLAANALLIHLLQMMAYGLDGFAHAAEALAGGAYGAKNKVAFQQSVKVSTIWALIVAVLIAVLYGLLGFLLIGLMTSIEAVEVVANEYLPWLIAAPIIAVWSYQLDGLYIGVTKTRVMLYTVALSWLVYVLLLWAVADHWGNHGLWACLMVFLLLRGVFLAIHYPKLLSHFHENHK